MPDEPVWSHFMFSSFLSVLNRTIPIYQVADHMYISIVYMLFNVNTFYSEIMMQNKTSLG